jgi:SAM-dependent methyltransferase
MEASYSQSRIAQLLVCSACHAALAAGENIFRCTSCGKTYTLKNDTLCFLSLEGTENADRPDDLAYRIKKFFKKFPSVFLFLYFTVAIFIGKTSKNVIKDLSQDAVILNIGSGVKRIDPRVINIDIALDENVDVIASIYELPFDDKSVDAIIAESLFEHLEHPEKAVAEIHRVLKNKGLIYIVTPFMLGFHSSPHDYYRWTIPGMKLLLSDFSIYESGIAVGPTGAMVAMLREWLAMLLSFGSRTLYQLWTLFFMLIFIPLNLFDFLLVRFSYSSITAHSYYFIGRKK